MKRHFIYGAIAMAMLTLVSCGNNSEKKEEKGFDYSGKYQTVATDSLELGYYQTLDIQKIETGYKVAFSASDVNGKPGCSFDGEGYVANDTLFVNVGDSTKEVLMTITPTKDNLGVSVFTKNFEDRYQLMYYCSGGGSLADTYYKHFITSDAIGSITKGETIGELINSIPEAQISKEVTEGEHVGDKYDDYKIFDEGGNLLLTITPKTQDDLNQPIERIVVNNPMFCTENGINKFSTFGEIAENYPNYTIEPVENEVVVTIEEINCSFSFPKSILLEGWWDEANSRVNPNMIPGDAKPTEMIIWWNK